MSKKEKTPSPKKEKKVDPIINNSTLNKTFSFSKEGVNLSFTLRVDIDKELVAFKELLEVATLSVTTEILNLK